MIKMKRVICIGLSFIFLFCIVSCSIQKVLPDSIMIEEKEFKRAFAAELYPIDDSFLGAEDINISGVSYYKYQLSQQDCYIAYDSNAEPNLYFSSEEYEAALSYYGNANNYNFFCLIGNIHDDNQSRIYSISSIDSVMFDRLVDFAKTEDYNPFASFNDEEELRRLPVADPDNWMDDEIHFYKESKDEAFSTLKGYTFVLTENKLALLYQYDFSNTDSPQMLIRDIPTEISDYFCTLLKELPRD